jgi:polyisoprenoid-binding protein YceI
METVAVATQTRTLWDLDPAHSSAGFSIRHLMVAKVHGAFTKLSGQLQLDPQDPSRSSVEAVIDASSIDTHEPKRDDHLRSAEFFDVAKFPTLTFRSRRISLSELVGDLTIHGITREVRLELEGLESGLPEVKDPWGNMRTAVSARTKIKRTDFGLTWNAALEAGGVLVGDEVTITLEIQFVRRQS